MCLAVPMKLVEKDGNVGVAEVGGVRSRVRLDLVDAEIGQSVIVHAGFAIQVLDEEEANDTLALLKQVAELPREGEGGAP